MSNKQLPHELIVGSRWDYGGRTYRIMAIVEGYVMYRLKGCGPSVTFWKDFLKRFQLKQLPQKKGEGGK